MLSLPQETFSRQEVCIHRASAPPLHRYSTLGAGFSTCLVGGVNGGQGTCSGRPSTKHLKYHRDWSSQLFPGHVRLFNQDNSTVGRLTSEDLDKARNAKKTDTKQHKQVVSALTPLFTVSASVSRQVGLFSFTFFSSSLVISAQ